MRAHSRLRHGATAAVTAFALTGMCACTGGDRAERPPGSERGQLTVLSLGPVATWDPQRIASPQDIAFAGRVFTRTLTAFPPPGTASRSVQGDLATDTGTRDASLLTWTFTLRDGVRWQDGSPVTCEDVRYGISRSFAAPFATEGLNLPLAYLDIPRTATGASTYRGPWVADRAGQAAFDKAVSCSGRTVTFRLSTPMADFDQVVSLPVFAPVKKDADRGKDAPYAVFSNGPYLLKQAWDDSNGGTFVRNPHWAKSSDPIRAGLPDSIRYVEGTESQTAVQQVINDDGPHQQSVTLDSAPPTMQQHVRSDAALRGRSVNPSGLFVDYLAPNVASGVMRDPRVRRALALATTREGYVTALGGASAATPAYTLIGPGLPGHRQDDPVGSGVAGDPRGARAALESSGLTLPVPIRVAYRSSPIADKAMAALANRWEEGGFEVQLQPIAKDYYSTISARGRASRTDVFWVTWAPAWPSAGTVLRPLFDSRINLTPDSTGRDVGGFADPAVDREMTRIAALPDVDAQAVAWADLDANLAGRGAFVALAQRRALYIAGSRVTGLAANEQLGGFIDLAAMGVE